MGGVGDSHGYFAISRKSDHDPLWTEPRVFSRWEAWEYMIRNAAWKPRKRYLGNEIVYLERGEFVASLRYLAKAWGWGKKAVHSFMDFLSDDGRIKVQNRGHKGTTYLVVNYDSYQSLGDAGGTGRGQVGDSKGTKKKKVIKGRKEVGGVTLVLNHYKNLHPRRQVGDEKQERLVEKALALGFSAEDLQKAISGNANDSWHRQRRKHELGYVLRNADLINQFIDQHDDQETPMVGAQGELIS